MKKATTLLALLLLIGGQGYSQKTVKEWSEMEDKKFFKKEFYNSGIQHVKKIALSTDEFPDLKRVGMMSFSIITPNYANSDQYFIYSAHFSDDGTKYIADIMYDEAAAQIKSEMDRRTITLLSPEEYCDTDEKKKIHEEIEFEYSKLFKFVASMQTRLAGGDSRACAEGQKFVGASNADAKIWRATGKYAGDMDLDAVVVIETHFGFDGNNMILQKIVISLIGPNTAPQRDEQKKLYAPIGPLKGYIEGINYGAIEITSPAGGILLVTMKKMALTGLYLDGLGDVYARILGKTIDNTEAEIAKSKEKVK